MANVLVNDSSLMDIADAIREKNGTEEKYKPAEMGDAVRAIESGGDWYDFYVEATSDISNTTEFLIFLSPYLSNLEPMKNVAIVTMLDANVQPVSASGVPLISYIYKRKDTQGFAGATARYRNENMIATAVELSTSSAIKVDAGYRFYIKVVDILV